MATIEQKFVYPPNWDYFYPVRYGVKSYTINRVMIGTATADETDVVLVTPGDFYTIDGEVGKRLHIQHISYTMSLGDTAYLKLAWDRTDKPIISVLSGWGSTGTKDARVGGYGAFEDPGEGGTGAIILSTVGVTTNDTYDITISFAVKPR